MMKYQISLLIIRCNKSINAYTTVQIITHVLLPMYNYKSTTVILGKK